MAQAEEGEEVILSVPPRGAAEVAISMQINCQIKSLVGWHVIRDNYEIKCVGAGNDAMSFVFEKIQREKTKTSFPAPEWDDMLVVRTACSLGYPALPPSMSNEEKLSRIREPEISPIRKKCILEYAEKINDTWSLPLFLSGTVFGENNTAYMLDGARRVTARALRGETAIDVFLVVTREELPRYLNPKDLESINESADTVPWFPRYQAIPEVGLKGKRDRKKLSLFDLSVVKGRSVADFGCNTGQACLEFYYAGAWKVFGFDCQKEAIATANKIQQTLNLNGVYFSQVDFNEKDCWKNVESYFGEKFDYSAFFAIYRTKEIANRDELFQHVINVTSRQIFFEGHADPTIDTLEYYEELFKRFKLKSSFVGYSEDNTRPCYVLEKT